jgi:hypothetical protein
VLRLVVVGCVALFLSLALVFAVTAQDQATPTEEALCATPLGEANAMASAALVVTAPTTAASPGGSEPGTPIGLFPCETPIG